MKQKEIITFDKSIITLNVYDDVKNPKGCIQVIHGMQEHCGRYIHLAKFFNDNGFIIVTYNQRGHGEEAVKNNMAGKSDGDIYMECVKDAIAISEYLSQIYNLPLYVYGHSFGSLVTQKYIQECHIAKKIILSGTANGSDAVFGLGKFVASVISFFCGKHHSGKMIEKISFGSYEKQFEDKNWLSRDSKVLEAYNNDPLCGVSFPISFYKNLFKNLRKLNKNINKITNDTKILIISGDKDPLGRKGKGVTKLAKIYKKKGVNVTLKLYKDGRHELHNELNKEEVFNDVLNFLNKD